MTCMSHLSGVVVVVDVTLRSMEVLARVWDAREGEGTWVTGGTSRAYTAVRGPGHVVDHCVHKHSGEKCEHLIIYIQGRIQTQHWW